MDHSIKIFRNFFLQKYFFCIELHTKIPDGYHGNSRVGLDISEDAMSITIHE